MDLFTYLILVIISIIGIFVTACFTPPVFTVALVFFFVVTCFVDVKR